ncbi:MAG: fibronectin type III domain-containing protein [Ignavibacteriaceae bacterium]|jgi:hypothetical protein
MSKIKSDLNGKNVDEEIQATKNRYTALTGSEAKVTVDAAKLSSYQNAINAVEAKESALLALKDKQKQAVIERDTALETLEKIDASIVDEINGKTGDMNLLLTTGFPVAADRSPSEPLQQVTNLSAAIGDEAGEIDVNFDRVKTASGYEFQISVDNPESWVIAGATGKTSKYTFTGLTAGKKYWIRVRAFKGEEKGTWSNPVSATAPH